METEAKSVPVVKADEINARLTQTVKPYLQSGSEPIRILDAGCGRMWTWDLQGVPFHLTGIDEDADALRLRVEVRKDLDEAIVGDLRTVPLEAESYDIVHSAFVLEHVDGAAIVLDRMLAALRPGGLMVLKVPDGASVYGFMARSTPHSWHVFYKRTVRRKKLAGTPGHGPYPVVYDEVISLPGMLAWAEQRGLEVVTVLGENSHLKFFGKVAPLADLGLKAVAALSFGRLTGRYANLAFVFRKPA